MKKLFVVMVAIGFLFPNFVGASPISQKKAKQIDVAAQAIEVLIDSEYIDVTIPQGKRLVKSLNKLHDVFAEVARTQNDEALEGQIGLLGDLDQKIRAYNRVVGYEAIEPSGVDFGSRSSGIPNYR